MVLKHRSPRYKKVKKNCTNCMNYSKRFARCKLKQELISKNHKGECIKHDLIPENVLKKRSLQDKNKKKEAKAKKCIHCDMVKEGWCNRKKQWAALINDNCNYTFLRFRTLKQQGLSNKDIAEKTGYSIRYISMNI